MGGPFRRVLVGWDGSPDSVAALTVAAEVAARDGGHVVAITVVRQQAVPETDDEGNGGKPAIARLAEARFEQLRQKPSASAVRLSVHVLVDSRNTPGHVVCDYAAEHGFDLLIVGRHGETGGRRSRLGRVADEAVQCSQVPLLLLSAT
jgi:nucleotide-binding universal stress UspA family protein